MEVRVKDINKNQLYMIKGLWEKLNEIHLKDSTFFKDHYQTFTFEKRCEKFLKMSDKTLKIQILESNNVVPVGYCMSTIDKEVGEIESLFIDEAYRHNNLGKQLVENAIKWMKDNHCTKIGVSVAQGHESVVDFYKQFGFYQRLTYLQLK
jgi:ribosomal protein S18 acetylase RimI-like enzyme